MESRYDSLLSILYSRLKIHTIRRKTDPEWRFAKEKTGYSPVGVGALLLEDNLEYSGGCPENLG